MISKSMVRLRAASRTVGEREAEDGLSERFLCRRAVNLPALCLAKIGGAFRINNIQSGRVTCDMGETQLSRSFGEEQDKKNGQIAHRRIVAGWEILRNHERNNNSPGTGR